jgi:putative ABC transport system ATP-binding protein
MSYQVTVRDLSFRPPDNSLKGVLNDVSFSVEAGEFVSIVGRNGQGKTTIIRAIAGELDPHYTSGEVYVGNNRVTEPVHTAASGVGIVHQFVQDDLIESLSIMKNIQIRQAFSNDRKSRKEATRSNWMGDTNGLISDWIRGRDFQVDLNTLVGRLSGGQRQILNVLIALKLEHPLKGCHLLLLDEHLTGLDVVIQKRVMALIDELTIIPGQEMRAVTIIMVTHNLEIALKYSHRILTIRDGAIAEEIDNVDASRWTSAYLEGALT